MCEMPWGNQGKRTMHPLSTEVITRQSDAASSYKQARLSSKLCVGVGTGRCVLFWANMGVVVPVCRAFYQFLSSKPCSNLGLEWHGLLRQPYPALCPSVTGCLGPPCTTVSLLWDPVSFGLRKGLAAVPGAPVAHWAMNMQCLSSNTQVRWRQPLLEQQLPGWRVGSQAVCTVFTQGFVPGLEFASFCFGHPVLQHLS